MDTVVDVVPAGETVIAVKADPTAPVDLLGRQEIVDRIMKILEVISEKRSSCTFALNGAWGTGKTFVLNMLMNQLWEYHSDKYIVFHYNCWQYDYYEEPLIAIVAAMLDSVDEENHLLPENLRDKAKAGMELAKPVLKKIATDFVKNKIGVDLTDVISSVKDYQEALDAEEQKKAESRSFDEFYSFKKAIQQAQIEINKLAKKRTLVVIVDELDRCLPDYAIKVLERLHHLFIGIENVSIVLGIDKDQLNNTIIQIFGGKRDISKYLNKFINFELPLDVGSITGSFIQKHFNYFNLFDKSLTLTNFPYDKFLAALFSGIDVRTQEHLINRITVIHKLLFPDKLMGFAFMVCELFLLLLEDIYHETVFPFSYNPQNGTYGFYCTDNSLWNKELDYFISRKWTEKYNSIIIRGINYKNGKFDVLEGDNVIQSLLYYCLAALFRVDDSYTYDGRVMIDIHNPPIYSHVVHDPGVEFYYHNVIIKEYVRSLEQVKNLLNIIK